MPPQVPSDAHDASKVEEPVAAAAALGSLGSESQDSRHVQTDSEVPELCALMVCCYALRVFHRVLSGLLQVATAAGSTRNLPLPTMSTMSNQYHLPLNAFLDTTRDPPVESARATVAPAIPAVRERERSRASTGLIISVAAPSAAP
jgi:hypothetical protein